MTEESEFEPGMMKFFLFLLVINTGSWAHPSSSPMCTGGSSKRPGREADHSLPTSAEVKKMWIYTCTPPYVFIPTNLPFLFKFIHYVKLLEFLSVKLKIMHKCWNLYQLSINIAYNM
jgi:hypothetical protein